MKITSLLKTLTIFTIFFIKRDKLPKRVGRTTMANAS